MTTAVIMRPLADGSGFSPCFASEENVGKRRCKHAHSTVNFNVQIEKDGSRVTEVKVPKEYLTMSKKDKEVIVAKFIDTLKPIDKATADRVIAQLQNM